MADALIRCPSCDHELRVPPELLGRAVECPQCGSRFTSPSTGQAPIVRPAVEVHSGETFADDPAGLAFRAAAALRPPAILLIIASILGFLWNGMGLLTASQVKADPATWNDRVKVELDKNPDLNPQERAQIQQWMAPDNVVSKLNIGCGGLLIGNALILIGAIQMLRLRGYGLAVLGSVFALNPINVPCCLLHAPFGLWALIVLLNQEVRAAFR